jgi:hypothetical protein
MRFHLTALYAGPQKPCSSHNAMDQTLHGSYVNRISIYVHTKMIRTSRTTPSVRQVVPLPLLVTVPSCFLDAWVATRLPITRQLLICWTRRSVAIKFTLQCLL